VRDCSGVNLEWKEWHIGDAVTSKIRDKCIVGSMCQVVLVLHADNRNNPPRFCELCRRDIAQANMADQAFFFAEARPEL